MSARTVPDPHGLMSRYAQRSTEWEAIPVGSGFQWVYSDGGSGESIRMERLAGATPQTPMGAILEGRTSSFTHGRKAVRRRVAAQRAQRMGRKVRPPSSRQIPSLFAFSGTWLVCWP